jgi:PAS domain S-box-containing protein
VRLVGAAAVTASGRSRRIPLSFYLVGLLMLFVLTAAGAALVVRAQSHQDAERAARDDARFAAGLAASEVASALAQIDEIVTGTAANPGAASVFVPGSPCNVAFGAVGVFQQTRLDFIVPAGSVSCSSAGPTAIGVSHSGAPWFSQALQGAVFAAPVLDPRTGRVSVVTAAPLADRGVVAVFADLTDLAPALAARFGGPRKLEFLITTPDGKTALTRSLDTMRWSGTSIDGTSFATTAAATRPDLDDTIRIYGEAIGGASGWKVYAGAEQAAVTTGADALFDQELLVIAVGLVAILLGTLFVYRRAVGPIAALSRSVGGVNDAATAHLVPVSGPAEIAQLAENFNQLITTVKTQLADRERAEAGARAMLDASLSAIVGMDGDGKIVEWSRQAEATFGWSRGDVLGRPLVTLIVPERYRARHIAGLAQYKRTGDGPALGKHLELAACTRDGREIPIELSITPTPTPSGHLFTAFIRDISDQRRSEQDRQGLEEQLRQSERLEGIGRLAGGIAHDFNNILAVVMNYSQFVEDTLPAGSEVRDDVVQIRLAAERGATFTRQLLTFAHRGAVNPQNVQLNSILGELQTMLRRTIPSSVNIELRLASDLSTVRIDVGQLEQLLLNLIVNAADAMPDGGTVLLATTNVELNGHGPSDPDAATRFVQVDVGDTGYGMSAEVLARAFEPFFTTKARGKGTGLGLATAYGIVQQALGTITIESAVGRGTTVRVRLPAQVGVQPEPARISTSPVPEAAPRKATVLVAEDETAVRMSVIRILSDRGYRALQASGPTAAIEVATLWSGSIDVLLTDIVMPDMSGDELARELRKARPNLRVVYMTGYSGDLDPATLRIDGPVVQKPFTRESLLAALEEVLAEKR